ncbi:hypothetical protein AUJ66_08760 [Candidatus Desantisbacteria bacterium CG1_02_38_46]|uniref:Uncharacterized protein n=2 Tax=unclassified Candidatus Desantisiibacteriota TaxID=3106372 RepID=A0A1J4S8M4_9BACT|nr:MAG: hypothetical protein AUJ66_08760 [Candidatus Desantisbacteria bacterium CG1_02_38_46]PIU51026.1 MAG: hypothetical protein COS91_06500 [Candidatus Desantisbacteria bacterium CG07_land_8_20_14_0_80_39_15]
MKILSDHGNKRDKLIAKLSYLFPKQKLTPCVFCGRIIPKSLFLFLNKRENLFRETYTIGWNESCQDCKDAYWRWISDEKSHHRGNLSDKEQKTIEKEVEKIFSKKNYEDLLLKEDMLTVDEGLIVKTNDKNKALPFIDENGNLIDPNCEVSHETKFRDRCLFCKSPDCIKFESTISSAEFVRVKMEHSFILSPFIINAQRCNKYGKIFLFALIKSWDPSIIIHDKELMCGYCNVPFPKGDLIIEKIMPVCSEGSVVRFKMSCKHCKSVLFFNLTSISIKGEGLHHVCKNLEKMGYRLKYRDDYFAKLVFEGKIIIDQEEGILNEQMRDVFKVQKKEIEKRDFGKMEIVKDHGHTIGIKIADLTEILTPRPRRDLCWLCGKKDSADISLCLVLPLHKGVPVTNYFAKYTLIPQRPSYFEQSITPVSTYFLRWVHHCSECKGEIASAAFNRASFGRQENILPEDCKNIEKEVAKILRRENYEDLLLEKDMLSLENGEIVKTNNREKALFFIDENGNLYNPRNELVRKEKLRSRCPYCQSSKCREIRSMVAKKEFVRVKFKNTFILFSYPVTAQMCVKWKKIFLTACSKVAAFQVIIEENQLRCNFCNALFPKGDLEIKKTSPLQPDGSSVIFEIECGHCKTILSINFSISSYSKNPYKDACEKLEKMGYKLKYKGEYIMKLILDGKISPEHKDGVFYISKQEADEKVAFITLGYDF